MEKWYVSVQNKAKGPYTDLQMRKKIKEGTLKAETLTYREGDADWQPLEKQDIWSPSFTPKEGPQVRESQDWVLLVESPIKKGDYQQQGPFSEEEVKEKVETGEVHLKDYCWRPGMEKWQPLFESSELGLPRKDKIVFEEEKQETVESQNLDIPKKRTVAESMMPDFLEPHKVEADQGEYVEEMAEKKTKKTGLLPPLIDKEGERKEVFSFLFSVLALFLLSFSLGYYFNAELVRGMGFVGDKVSSFSKSLLSSGPQATGLFIRELPLSRNSFVLKTDAGEGAQIEVKLFAKTGKRVPLANGGQKLFLTTNKNGEVFLDLQSFKLKRGQSYLVSARTGNLTATKTFYYFSSEK